MTDYRALIVDLDELRSKLSHIMGRKGLSCDQLGAEIGMHRNSVMRFLKNETKANIKNIYKMNEYVKKQNEEGK